jgi:hypothetical protein
MGPEIPPAVKQILLTSEDRKKVRRIAIIHPQPKAVISPNLHGRPLTSVQNLVITLVWSFGSKRLKALKALR